MPKCPLRGELYGLQWRDLFNIKGEGGHDWWLTNMGGMDSMQLLFSGMLPFLFIHFHLRIWISTLSTFLLSYDAFRVFSSLPVFILFLFYFFTFTADVGFNRCWIVKISSVVFFLKNMPMPNAKPKILAPTEGGGYVNICISFSFFLTFFFFCFF